MFTYLYLLWCKITIKKWIDKIIGIKNIKFILFCFGGYN